MEEDWTAVPGFEGLYEASTLGRVRSLDRIDLAGRSIKGRILKPGVLKDSGRLQVVLCKDGQKHQLKVHKVIALTYHGPCPSGMEIRHYPDSSVINNRPENLRYGTKRENHLDSVEHGTHRELRKTECPRGHLLQKPNLRQRDTHPEWRECLACHLAGSKHYLRSSPEFGPLADRLYREIAVPAISWPATSH